MKIIEQVFSMNKMYVISDNQYFNLGVLGILKKNVIVINPQDILDRTKGLDGGICFVYIRDRDLHYRLCYSFRNALCKFIFFLPNMQCVMEPAILHHFWPATLDTLTFQERTSKISHDFNLTLTPSRLRLINDLSQGIVYYTCWIRKRCNNPKTIHNHYRDIIKAAGIYGVSVHNLFLSEYIAVSYMVII